MIKWQIKHYDALSKDELYSILKFRIGIFMLEQNSIYEDIDNQDQSATHFLGHDNSHLIAYGRVNLDSKNHVATIRRICVHQDYRNQKLGKAIMKNIIEYLDQQKNLEYVELNAQHHLQNFYEKLGFQVASDPYDDGGVMHVRMVSPQ